MNIDDDPFDQNIDWSTVPLPEVTNAIHNNNNNNNNNNDSIHKHNQQTNESVQNNNTSISSLQARLSQLENLLAEKDSRLFDLESSIAVMEAETQYSIQSANQSQHILQSKEDELRRMQQMIEKKNMVIVRLQKKRGRGGEPSNHSHYPSIQDENTSRSTSNNHNKNSNSHHASSSPVGISDHAFEDRVQVLSKEQHHHQQPIIHDENTTTTSIGIQTDEITSNNMNQPSTIRRSISTNAWRLQSCLPSLQSLHLNFSFQEKITIPQLCGLVLSRIYSSHDDLKLMVALYDLCCASVDSRDFIRWTFDSFESGSLSREQPPPWSASRKFMTTRIRGLTLPEMEEQDSSDVIRGRLGPILRMHIIDKEGISEEESYTVADNQRRNELRNICLKIILVLMHNAPNESGIWTFGISFMDEYFADILQILERKASKSLDYTHKQYIIDIMAFTIEYKANRVESFFFQDTASMERLLLAFTHDVKRHLSQLDDLIDDPECFGLQYLLSLMGLFVSLVHLKDGFELVRAQVNYSDNQYASCIGMAFATMDKELHLLEKNINTFHVSTELRHQIVRRCVHFFYSLNAYTESTASGKRPVALIDILQDADITHRLVFCLRSVIRFRNHNKISQNELFEAKTRSQATSLLQSIQKGLKSIQET